jgi:hypothetical protein
MNPPFTTSAKSLTPVEATKIAAEVEIQLGKIANGEIPPAKLTIKPLISLIQFARDTAAEQSKTKAGIGEEVIMLTGIGQIEAVRQGIQSNAGSMKELNDALDHMRVVQKDGETVWLALPTMPRDQFRFLTLYVTAFGDGQSALAHKTAKAFSESGQMARKTIVDAYDAAQSAKAGRALAPTQAAKITAYTTGALGLADDDHARSYGPSPDLIEYHGTYQGRLVTLRLTVKESEGFEEMSGHTMDSDTPESAVFSALIDYLKDGGVLPPAELGEPSLPPDCSLPAVPPSKQSLKR